MRSYRHEDGVKVAEALAENDVAVELNSRYRIEHVEFLEAARDFGCMFTLGSDAHWVDAIGRTKAQAEIAAALNLPLLEIP